MRQKTFFGLMLTVVSALIFTSLAAGAQPEQSHNLSEIYPVDTDFDMSEYGIFGASHFELQDGLNISGYSVFDQGGVKLLEYDTGNREWDVNNSDIDLNGGTLTDSTENLTLDGNVEVPNGDLNVSGQLSVNSTECPSNQVLIGNGGCSPLGGVRNKDLVAGSGLSGGANDVLPGSDSDVTLTLNATDLDADGDINSNVITNTEIANSDSFTLNGVTLNSNLDLSGNNITDIDTLHFQQGMTINGSINTSGGDSNLGGGNLNDVTSIDGGGDSIRFDDNIDMNGNNLTASNTEEICVGNQC